MGTKYTVVEGDNAEDLASKVNKRIVDGWTLAGGVSVSLSETDECQYYTTAQAMKKNDDSELNTWCKVIGIGLLIGVALQIGIKAADYAIPDPPREPLTIEFADEG